MSLEELIKEKLNRIRTVPDAFVSRVDKANEVIFNQILDQLNQLETKDGKIILSQKNLQISEQITSNLRKAIFDTDYLDALKAYANQYDKQAELTDSYFEKAFDDFTNEAVYDDILKASKLSAIELLSEDAVYKEFINPIKDILNGSITAGGTFTDAIKTLRDYTLGTNEQAPALTRYVKQIAYDSFAFSDRQYSKVISETLKVFWYKYSGGELPDSRPFCVEYHNEFFSKREIEDFGKGIDLDGKQLTQEMLQGRYPETNASTIFTFAGGYNCKHTYLPVSEFSVPQKVILRNKLKGYVKN